MNSKFVRICSAIGVASALKLELLDIDLNDISTLDAYAPSKFFENMEKIGTPDELISTLADIRMYNREAPALPVSAAPAELGGLAGPESTSSATSANSITPSGPTTTSPSSTNSSTGFNPTSPTAPTAPEAAVKSTEIDPILDMKPLSSNTTSDDQAFGAPTATNTTTKASTKKE